MRHLVVAVLAVTFASAYLYSHGQTWDLRSSYSKDPQRGYVPPASLLRTIDLGFHGIVSDQIFLNLVTYVGEHILYQRKLEEKDWDYFVRAVDTVTDLDPYFLDPYFLTEGLLAWEARRFDDANRILSRGAEHRSWDWRLPYFIGFNNFYFLKDYKEGAKWIMKASEVPDSPDYLPTLASRLAYYGGEPGLGIAFLKEFRTQVTETSLQSSIDRRLRALEIAVDLEKVVAEFKKEMGRLPGTMQELVDKGFVDTIPDDPYGGRWGILENGRVFSTSRFVLPLSGQDSESP